MPGGTSQHILNAAANLLGFCLFVITSLHIGDATEGHQIDEFTSVVAVLLTFSCLCSFVSIRTRRPALAERAETIADYLFAAALVGILVVIVVMTIAFIE